MVYTTDVRIRSNQAENFWFVTLEEQISSNSTAQSI